MDKTQQHWLKWIEPWYLVYAIMGLVVAGLVPVLIPLVVGKSGNAGQVGLVVAAVSLGGLTAPLWGNLADRYRAHRVLLAGGMLVACLGLAAFAFTTQALVWILLAMLAGLGSASAATVANLFVVEAHPQAEWDERIGWLQTFYGVGQVAGLLLAGALTRIDLHIGLLAAAGLSAAAAILGWLTTQTPPAQPGRNAVLLHPAKHVESAISSPQRLFHAPKWLGMQALGRTLRSPYGVFLVIWLLAFAGPAAVFSQYPLFMQKVFGVTPGSFLGGFCHHRRAGPVAVYPGRQLVQPLRSAAHPEAFPGAAPAGLCRDAGTGFPAGQRDDRLAGPAGLRLRGLGLVLDERERDCPGGAAFAGRRGPRVGDLQCHDGGGGHPGGAAGRLGGGDLGVRFDRRTGPGGCDPGPGT